MGGGVPAKTIWKELAMANDSRSSLGSKREVRPGVWELRVSNGYRSDGTRKRLTRTVHGTERDADRALVALADEMGRVPMLGERSTLADFWPRFMRRCEAKGLTNATIKKYQRHWERDIEPELGSLTWADLRYGVVQDWVYGMTPAEARSATRTLKRMINCAVDVDLLDHNPLDHRHLDYPVTRPDITQEPPMQWGADQVAEAVRRLRGFPVEALYLVLVGGGLRVEEGLALEWADLDFSQVTHMDGTEGWMCHARVYKAWTPDDGLKGTKNAFSRRVVPIPDPFATRLRELVTEGPVWPMSRSNVRRTWKALFDSPAASSHALSGSSRGALHGMPYARLKDLRSIHETLMQEAGALDTVNARLHGRTNVQTGYTHYLRPSKALDDAAEAFGRSVAIRPRAVNG